MEKFSTWRDPGTGLHPFLPLPCQPSSNYLTAYGLKPLILILKLPFVVVTLGLIGLTDQFHWQLVGQYLVPILLFFLGYYSVTWKPFQPKLSKFTNQTLNPREGGRENECLTGEDVLVGNLSSFVDVLLLKYKFNPTFTVTQGSSGKVKVVNLTYFLFNSVGLVQPLLGEDDQLKSLPEIYHSNLKGGRPLMLFPEGCTTNGKGILNWETPLSLHLLPKTKKVHLIGIKYPYLIQPQTQPTQNTWQLLLTLASQLSNSVVVHIAYHHSLNWEEPIKDGVLLQKLASLTNVRALSLNAGDKLEFLKFYNKK